jgi:hypothetical protein
MSSDSSHFYNAMIGNSYPFKTGVVLFVVAVTALAIFSKIRKNRVG